MQMEISMVCFLKHPKIKSIIFTLILISSTAIPFMSLRCGWFFREPSYEPFKQIEAYKEVQKIFDACDRNTLVTFDVDDTLITAVDVMANFDFPLWFGIRAFLKYPEVFLSKKALEPILSRLFQQSERFVFDPDIVGIIKQLQRQGCTVVALTGIWNGAYGCIDNMPEWRASMLNKFDINFADEKFPDISFTALPKNHGNYACLYKGIICANQEEKGKVLEAFLDHFAHKAKADSSNKTPNYIKPTQIISFDDQEEDLNSIAKMCAKNKISFAGYQMLGGKKLCGKWNTNRALLQLDFLKQDDLWLSDKEAEAILAGEIKNA